MTGIMGGGSKDIINRKRGFFYIMFTPSIVGGRGGGGCRWGLGCQYR